MLQNPESLLKKKLWQWSVLAAALLFILLGLLVPNRTPVELSLFWLWNKILPLWGALTLALLLGGGLGVAVTISLWWKERLRRFRAEASQKKTGAELNELRKLLVKEENNDKNQ